MMLVVGSLWLTGCSQTNTVNTLSTVPQPLTAEGRFQHLYPGKNLSADVPTGLLFTATNFVLSGGFTGGTMPL